MREVGEMRVVTVALRSRQTGRVAGYVQYGRDEQHIDSTVGRLWLLIAAGVIGATVLASLAGVAIARRAMRPISSLTATAREIAETGDPSSHMPQPRADDEVGELARTLQQMLLSLDAARSERESALRRQREFVADASHELRTPLTSILANLELLQDSLDSPAREDERAMVDSALRSSGRMRRLVGDLLLLAHADAGRIGARTHCDLAEAAGHAAAEVAPTIGERELRVRSDRPLPVDGNPDELHRMVLNLLDNAARHTPPGSTIELRLRAEGRDARGRGRRRRSGRAGGAARADLRALRARRRPGGHRGRRGQRARPGDRPGGRRVPRRQRRGRRIGSRRRPLPRPPAAPQERL